MTTTVSVRALCEFTAKRGDLDHRFTPSPTAEEGMLGHKTVAARRGGTHCTEVTVKGSYRHLTIRGRADGFDAARGLLEEVKTFRGDLARMPGNHRHLHWAQAKVYAWLLCEQHGLAALDVSLVYFDVDSQRETALTERHDAAALKRFFDDACERFIAWADSETAHRAARDAGLSALRFPHAAFRDGQRTLADAVFKTARRQACLMAQAPTGIGKTIGTLFPLLKACPGQAIDKLYFLTARTPGRALAMSAVDTLCQGHPALPLRVIELVARDKACEHPGQPCQGDACPLARGFYDRLPAARQAAAERRTLNRQALRDIALSHGVCPYYLGQEMARWCDVLVGDYNHYFDASALLHALAQANAWRVALLVDEAHNMVERARSMYSAQLSQADLWRLRVTSANGLSHAVDRLDRAWAALNHDNADAYHLLPEPPRHWLAALRDLNAAVSAQLADDATLVDAALLRFYFDGLRLERLAESFGAHSLFDLTIKNESNQSNHSNHSIVCLRNVVPASFLKPRFAAARASVLFSATLAPRRFYADMLGLPACTGWLDVAAPFKPEQLSVRVVRNVSTRFRQRGASLVPIVHLIGEQFTRRAGNYLAFFSSFDYLRQVADLFAVTHGNVPMWCQSSRMTEPECEAFLARFTSNGRGVGFAVLGGAFAEGIDLPGDRLIGAFIATLGLPQVNPLNEEIRQRMDAAFGDGVGYDYTYLYPGLRKVVQAAGRVIRTPTDRGSLHLIDDRFARPEVRRLLPTWWAL